MRLTLVSNAIGVSPLTAASGLAKANLGLTLIFENPSSNGMKITSKSDPKKHKQNQKDVSDRTFLSLAEVNSTGKLHITEMDDPNKTGSPFLHSPFCNRSSVENRAQVGHWLCSPLKSTA
ncbi:hypothetical protein SUGI_0991710 [Cryptomeria japonica]|nr:hypothetical protein SUGI_0991710 [Cryptomeria japonica]